MTHSGPSDPADHVRRLWRRLAFATRYGHTPLSEVLDLDERYLGEYCDALAQIVKEENAPKGRRR